MSENHTLDGISSNVELGDGGPRLKDSSGKVQVRNAGDSALANAEVADGVAATDAATKGQLDAVAGAAAPTSRNLTAGAGLTGGGDLTADRTFDAVANADASIVVNANDIQVGVLATDGQHGTRGGGTQHADAVAGVSAGFLSASRATKVDASALESITFTAGAGLTGGGDLTANRTFDAVANADASIVVNANDIQVGVLATDGQHGTRGGGTQHADAIAGGAAGFLSGVRATRIDASALETIDIIAGAGMTGGGDLTTDRTLNVIANADASLVVNANDMQVGVLATDGQHGVRGGGTQHANAIAAGAAGFMTGADKTKLDGLPTAAVPEARDLTAGSGMTGGGDLSADRTFNVIANADASIVANANDIQVGVLATDAQHGTRGGGTQHADVIAGGADGFMTGADKTKLDGLPSSAVPTSRTLTAGANIDGGGDLTANRSFALSTNVDVAGTFDVTGACTLDGQLTVGDSIVTSGGALADAPSFSRDGVFGDLTTNSGICITSSTTTTGHIVFTDTTAVEVASITYGHGTQQFTFRVESNDELILNATQLRPNISGGLTLGSGSAPFGDSFVADMDASGNVMAGGQVYAAATTATVSSNAVTLDFDNGNTIEFDMEPSTATVAVTLSNIEDGGRYFGVLLQGTGLDLVTFSASGLTIRWAAGTQPSVIGFNNRYQVYRFHRRGSSLFSDVEWQDELTPG